MADHPGGKGHRRMGRGQRGAGNSRGAVLHCRAGNSGKPDSRCLYDFGLSDRQTPIRDSLVSGLLLLTAVYAAQGVFRYLNMQLMNRTVSRHFTCDLRIAISDKIRRLPVKYVDQTPVGDVLNRMIDDVSAMGNYIHQVFDVMVEGVFQITMIAVAMFLKNWVLACLVIMPPRSPVISSKIAGASGKYYDEWFKKSGELTEIVEESFTNFATAKAYNLEEYTVQKHAVVNEQLRKAVSGNFTGHRAAADQIR